MLALLATELLLLAVWHWIAISGNEAIHLDGCKTLDSAYDGPGYR